MKETAAGKHARILKSGRDHGLLPPKASVPSGVLIAADIREPFKTLLAHPSKWSAPRGTTPTSVVIHCTAAENPAASTAAFFHSSADSGSTQAIADDVEGYTMVPDDAICAGAPPFNQEGLHIEQPGLTTWTRDVWLSHDMQLRRVAHHVRGWCDRYSIPMTLLHADDLKRLGEKARGITYHAAVSEAFHQSTHTDPQPNFPWDVFMPYVTEEDEMSAEDKLKLEKAANSAQRFEDYLDGQQLVLAGKPLPSDASSATGAGFQVMTAAVNRPKPGKADLPKSEVVTIVRKA